MANAYDVLAERGFIEQCSDEEGLRQALDAGPVTAYVGFDPTADSLHVGHMLPVMALANLQRCGHRPIALMGGGTGMIGDPSGKTEMRQILTVEDIDANVECIKEQISRFLDFSDDKALCLNNADWLRPLNYIDFLRDIGRHFSVNRMLAAEGYKQRFERGLNFIEFNYQILQSYDFLHLFQTEGNLLQMGGNDQWGNIVAGIDLIRRVEGETAYALTFPLITTSSGAKMGKTAQGAVWLDAKRLSPYDFYQFWINTEDADVERFLKLFTFLPLARIAELNKLEGAQIRQAKEVLAFEVTQLVHGAADAQQARDAARALFAGKGDSDAVPGSEIDATALAEGINVCELFHDVGLCKSRGAARRLIQQGGAYVNDDKVDSHDQVLTNADLRDGVLMLRAGKKRYHRVTVTE